MTDILGDPNLDFNVGRLMPPTAETRQAFGETIEELSILAGSSHSRTVDVRLSESLDSIKVYCSRSEWREPQRPVNIPPRDKLVVSVTRGDYRVSIGPGSVELPKDKLFVGDAIDVIAGGLDDPSAEWLRTTIAEARSADESLLPHIVDRVFEESPFPVHDHTTYTLNSRFNNGTRVVGQWVEANDEFFESWPTGIATRTINLITADGTSFKYSSSADQSEHLLVRKPDEGQAGRGLDPATILAELESGEGVAVYGSPELMKALSRSLIERREARRLGIDQVTDGSLADFAAALRDAVDSGIVLPNLKHPATE